MKRIFVTGISTEVGKTMASAVLVEAMQADYWKPVQAGDLDHTDSDKVRELISNSRSVRHPSEYALNTPMSPHAAAEIDGVQIELKHIVPPDTENHLIIEGAGGLLVPLNDTDTILDLIKPTYKVVVVSRHYLGSINHTLLTLDKLIDKGLRPYLLYSGDPNPSTETIVESRTRVPVLGRMEEQAVFSSATVKRLAAVLRPSLQDHGLL